MPTITLLDTLLGVFEKLSLAFIKNDAEQMKRYQIGLNAIMEQYGDMTDITPLFLANDLVKASVGDLKEITDIPVFEMFSNKTVNKEKNSNTTKLFLTELDRISSKIMGSSYKELNNIGKRVAKIEKNFTDLLKKKELTFSEQIQVYLKILNAQYLIYRESLLHGKDGVPCFDDTKNIDEKSRALVVLIIDIVRIIKFGEIYTNNAELQKIIEDIKIEITVYNKENIEHLLLLTRRANEIIEAYKANNIVKLEENKSLSDDTKNNPVKPILQGGLSQKRRLSFSEKRKIRQMQCEYGSKEKPTILIKRDREDWISTTYIEDSGFFIRMQERISENVGLSIKDLYEYRKSGIATGFTNANYNYYLFRIPIDQTGLYYYCYCYNSPKSLLPELPSANVSVIIERVSSPESLIGKAIDKVEALYSKDGSVRINEYHNSDIKNIVQSYFISINQNKNYHIECFLDVKVFQ